MASFLVSTTGADVTLEDLGNRILVDPLASYDLSAEYSLEEIRDSEDLRDAIIAGDLTATIDGVAVNSAALFDQFVEDFQNASSVRYTPTEATDWDVTPDDAGQALDELAQRINDYEDMPRKSFTYSAGDDGSINGDRDLQRTGMSRTNKSPFVVPIDGEIWGISLSSEKGVNVTFDVQILVNDVAVHTESVVAGYKAFNSAVSEAVSAGDEIRVRFVKQGDNIKDLGVEVYVIEV